MAWALGRRKRRGCVGRGSELSGKCGAGTGAWVLPGNLELSVQPLSSGRVGISMFPEEACLMELGSGRTHVLTPGPVPIGQSQFTLKSC